MWRAHRGRLWGGGGVGATKLSLSQENSSLLFEVGSVSTKRLLTSCERTEARSHLTEAERASRRAGGPRAEALVLYWSAEGRMIAEDRVGS